MHRTSARVSRVVVIDCNRRVLPTSVAIRSFARLVGSRADCDRSRGGRLRFMLTAMRPRVVASSLAATIRHTRAGAAGRHHWSSGGTRRCFDECESLTRSTAGAQIAPCTSKRWPRCDTWKSCRRTFGRRCWRRVQQSLATDHDEITGRASHRVVSAQRWGACDQLWQDSVPTGDEAFARRRTGNTDLDRARPLESTDGSCLG